jgi:hypothetical protein
MVQPNPRASSMHLTHQPSNRISSLKTRTPLLNRNSSRLNSDLHLYNSPRTSQQTNSHSNHNRPSKPVSSNKVQPPKTNSSNLKLNFSLNPSSRISDQGSSNNLRLIFLFNTDNNLNHSSWLTTLSISCRYLLLFAAINTFSLTKRISSRRYMDLILSINLSKSNQIWWVFKFLIFKILFNKRRTRLRKRELSKEKMLCHMIALTASMPTLFISKPSVHYRHTANNFSTSWAKRLLHRANCYLNADRN